MIEYKIKHWFREHELVVCADCRNVCFRKDIVSCRSLMDTYIDLCHKCRTKWFGGEQ